MLRPVINHGILPYSRVLGEYEGLYSPSPQELYDYAVKYGNTHEGILEFKARLEICMIFALIWTFGAVLPDQEKKVFSEMFKKVFYQNKGKYMYADDAEIFDVFID